MENKYLIIQINKSLILIIEALIVIPIIKYLLIQKRCGEVHPDLLWKYA